MILGSIILGIILGVIVITSCLYFKDYKEKKELKRNESKLKEKIQSENKRMKEVKNARERKAKGISERKREEHRSDSSIGTKKTRK